MNSPAFIIRGILTLALAVSVPQANAYEVNTHQDLAEEATKISSNLASQLPNFGLSSIQDVLQQGTTSLSIRDWIREGARREDDTISEVFARYRNHFFDPISEQGFGGILFRNSGIINGLPAPNWGLEDKGQISGQNYSFRTARQYMFDGLTAVNKVDRDSNIALMYRSMGDVMHLVQDMAQPQHTRNDGHGDGSLYEQYTDTVGVTQIMSTSSPVPIPAFSKAQDFFTNSSGTGMAKYSNKNFVTAGTNFSYTSGTIQPNAIYHFPVPTNQIEYVSVASLEFSPAVKEYCGQNCTLRFVSSENDQGEVQPRASTLSIFADDIDAYNINNLPVLSDQGLRFSMNRFNFDEAQKN